MFELKKEYQGFVWIASKDEFAILSQKALQRAQRRFTEKVKLQNPVVKTIDDEKFLFTGNEWDRATAFALEFQIQCARSDWHALYRFEKNDRHSHQKDRQKSYETKIQNQANFFNKISNKFNI